MHYIIGTQITISGRTVDRIKPGMTSTEIQQRSTSSSQFHKEQDKFEKNVLYTLSRIYRPPGQSHIVYRFNDGGLSNIELEFKSVDEAEDFISETRGESVPDYDNFNRTD
jgi:hypothetical protein